MKKNSFFKIAGIMVLLASFVLSCTPPVVEEPAGELDAIKTVSYTGSAVSTKAEAIDTTVYAMQTLTSVLGAAAVPSTAPEAMSVIPESMSKAPGDMPFEGLPEFLGAGFKGTLRYSASNSVNGQDGSSATMSNSVSLTTSHDLPLTAQPVIDIMNMDGNPETMDTKLPQTYYDFMTNQNPTFPYVLADNNALSAAVSLQSNSTVTNAHGVVTVDTTTVNLTINKAVLTVSANLNADASGVGVQMKKNADESVVPEVTAGSLNLASNYNLSFLMVVSSDNEAVKGGKLQITATYSKTISNISILSLYTSYTEQDMAAAMEALFGSLETIPVVVKVYDNDNNKVLEENLTLAELMAKLQS